MPAPPTQPDTLKPKTVMTIRLPALLSCAVLMLTACTEPPKPVAEAASTPASAPASMSASAASCAASDPATAASASVPTVAALQSVAVDEGIGGDFTLTAADGRPFALSSLNGKAVILAFGYTNCPDVCPTELVTYSEAVNLLGETGKEVAAVFVSVDPERDTPALIGRYVRQFHPDFIGLTDAPDGRALEAVKRQYRVVSAKSHVKSDRLYNVDHSAGAYLVDKNGRTVLFAPYGIEAPQLADDLRRVLAM